MTPESESYTGRVYGKNHDKPWNLQIPIPYLQRKPPINTSLSIYVRDVWFEAAASWKVGFWAFFSEQLQCLLWLWGACWPHGHVETRSWTTHIVSHDFRISCLSHDGSVCCYGRLMLTKLGFLLMVNLTMVMAYIWIRHGYDNYVIVWTHTHTQETLPVTTLRVTCCFAISDTYCHGPPKVPPESNGVGRIVRDSSTVLLVISY